MKTEDKVIIHKNQTELEDFLKVENKECLNCLECEDKICQSITCEYHNMSILDFVEYKCIHKRIEKQFDDGLSLFKEIK